MSAVGYRRSFYRGSLSALLIFVKEFVVLSIGGGGLFLMRDWLGPYLFVLLRQVLFDMDGGWLRLFLGGVDVIAAADFIYFRV